MSTTVRARARGGAPLALLALSLAARPAHADGAFPDSFAPLLPRTRPHEILLATNFGLVASSDDGATWSYACEVPESAGGRLYNLGAPPEERVHAVATPGLVTSDDGGCRWTVGAGALSGTVVLDGFPDPRDSAHVLAIAALAGGHDAGVFESRDAGVTFTGPIFTPPPGAVVTGVEAATGTAGTIYVTFYEVPSIHPRLARSDDAGASWLVQDLESALGAAVPFLAAVDPADAAVVYLRVSGRRDNEHAYEALALTRDGGATWTTPLILAGGTLTAFFRRAGGDLLATGTQAGAATAHRSRDGGATFQPWPLGIHPRGFAERDGILHAATDNDADGFALGTSADGDHWTPVMRYQDITAVRACIQVACATDCRYRAAIGLFAASICEPRIDVIVGSDGGMTANPGNPPPASSGCACRAGAPAAPDPGAALAYLGLAALVRLRRRRRPITSPL